MDREYWDNEQKFKNIKKQQQEVAAENAKQRIKKKAQISVQTCAIGSLSDFEHTFGYLWGHGKKTQDLTTQEKEMKDRWLEVRDSILDRAENSKRLLLREVDRCEFKEYVDNKYTTILRPKSGERYGRE